MRYPNITDNILEMWYFYQNEHLSIFLHHLENLNKRTACNVQVKIYALHSNLFFNLDFIINFLKCHFLALLFCPAAQLFSPWILQKKS